MHVPKIFAAVLLACSLASTAAYPQAKTVRYFELSSGLLGDLTVDGFLREERQGGKLVAATLDVCYPSPPTLARQDRFALTLRVDGDKLTGSGQTQEDKVAVTVSITRKQTGATVSLTGSVTRGQTRTDVASEDNSEVSEQEFRDNHAGSDPTVADPPDFTSQSPGSVAVRIKREALVDLVKELKSQNVEVVLDTLVADCAALRSGRQVVKIEVDPDRAPALVAKLKTVPGVLAAGWTDGAYSIENAIRLDAKSWRSADGQLDRDKLAAAIAASVAKALAASLDTTTWDPATGELTLKLKRPNQTIPQLGLTDAIDVTVLVGPEKIGSGDGLVIWLEAPVVETVDQGPEPRLKFVDVAGGEEEPLLVNMEDLTAALVRDLKARVWDSEQKAWK